MRPRGGCDRPNPPRSHAGRGARDTRAGRAARVTTIDWLRSASSALCSSASRRSRSRSRAARARASLAPEPTRPASSSRASSGSGTSGVQATSRAPAGDRPDRIRGRFHRRRPETGGAQVGDHALADHRRDLIAHREHDGTRDLPPPAQAPRLGQRRQQHRRDRRGRPRAAGQEVPDEVIAVDGGNHVPPGFDAGERGLRGVEDEQQRRRQRPRSHRGGDVRRIIRIGDAQREGVEERTAADMATEGNERGPSEDRRARRGHEGARPRPPCARDRGVGRGEIGEGGRGRLAQPEDDGQRTGGGDPRKVFGGPVPECRAAFEPRGQPARGGGRRAHEPPQRTDHVRRLDRGAVVEHRSRPQLQGPLAAVGRGFPRLGERRFRVEVAEVDQPLVDERRDQA